jgi:uncharacterized protein (DUF4213/DUF364 family)
VSGAADLILARLKPGSRVEQVVQGPEWILATVRDRQGGRTAGMAGIPKAMQGRCCVPGGAEPPRPIDTGAIAVAGDQRDAAEWAGLLRSPDEGAAATGLAVINALLAQDPEPAATINGVEWLLERAAGRDVAVIGRFPFIDGRLRPVAGRVWVFERAPADGELPEYEAAGILPQAQVVVITAGTLANGTLDRFVRLVPEGAVLLLLGPSTPLCSSLFQLGFDALSGVRILDVDAAVASVREGKSFRQMTGLQRVTLLPAG